jgi:predicted extracellular nuclease
MRSPSSHRRLGVIAAAALAASALVALPVGTTSGAPATDLFLSEYVEGSSFNKAIEISNSTGAAIDLTAGVYTLELYSNGSGSVSQSVALEGTIAAGDVFVVAHASADPAILGVTDLINSSVINFNGDDAVVLRKNGVVIDAFGEVGVDPGSEWVGGGLDDTLRRKAGFCAGDTNAEDAFDASVEWDVLAQNTFDGLGAHAGNCDGSTPPPPPPPPPPPLTCETPLDVTLISTVQGAGATSPIVGQTVVIDAVVTGIFPGLQGFYLQEEPGDYDDDPATSEGIFVFRGTLPEGVGVNDNVRVEGVVAEFTSTSPSGVVSSLTQIANSTVVDCDLPPVVIEPTEVELPRTAPSDLEPFEGMLVTMPQSLVISEYFNYDRFGEVVLTSERQLTPTAEVEPGPDAVQAAIENSLDRITIDDGRSTQNPDPAIHPGNGEVFDLGNLFRGGDLVKDITGVIDHTFGLYRLQPTAYGTFTVANPRPAAPAKVGGNVQVASFNVLNYFSTLDLGPDICGPLGNQECRGADNETELVRQRDKIVAAITAIDADVVGLIEIENHAADEAVGDLVASLNAVAGDGTYDAIETGPIGGDAIKVAFIHQPASVTPVGDFAILDSSVDARFIDTLNRPVLAQTYRDNVDGGVFTVAVNHLKSKGSSCDAVGDPDTGDGSANCNQTRTAAAEALVDWLATDPTGSGDDDVLIIGDLNAYDKETPIDAIVAGSDDSVGTDDDYVDLIAQFLGEHAYSYVFDGQVGYLDHALANVDLADQVTGATVWLINADEPDLIDYDTSFKQPAQDAIYAPDPYRSSDHDPVIVGLDVCDSIAPTFDELTVTPAVLWPPNGRYVDVETTVGVSDNFDPDPTVRLVSVTSSDPDDAVADGNTVDDIVIVDDTTFQLRAERSGAGGGRTYTITYEAVDACGNATTESVTVSVPRDRSDRSVGRVAI